MSKNFLQAVLAVAAMLAAVTLVSDAWAQPGWVRKAIRGGTGFESRRPEAPRTVVRPVPAPGNPVAQKPAPQPPAPPAPQKADAAATKQPTQQAEMETSVRPTVEASAN